MQSPQINGNDPLSQFYDYQDSEMLKIQIKQSNLPFSGMGLFATQKINNFEIIAQYHGSIIKSKYSMNKQFTNEDKMAEIDHQYCVISRGPASRANDIVKWSPQSYNSQFFKMMRKKNQFPLHPGFKHNAKIQTDAHQKAFLKATRDIPAGEEIFIDYGFEYWDFFYKDYLKSNSL